MPICKGLRLHLQHDYCALCFRVRPGSFTKVDRTDPRIDAVQAAHALKGRNGLRLLDLSRPGYPCVIDSGCRMLCLVIFVRVIKTPEKLTGDLQVCGSAVLTEDSRDWARIVCFAKSAEDKDDEHNRTSVLRQAALRNRCRMTSRWSTLVHERSSFFFRIRNPAVAPDAPTDAPCARRTAGAGSRRARTVARFIPVSRE